MYYPVVLGDGRPNRSTARAAMVVAVMVVVLVAVVVAVVVMVVMVGGPHATCCQGSFAPFSGRLITRNHAHPSSPKRYRTPERRESRGRVALRDLSGKEKSILLRRDVTWALMGKGIFRDRCKWRIIRKKETCSLR